MVWTRTFQLLAVLALCLSLNSCIFWNRLGMNGKVMVVAGAGAAGAVSGSGSALAAGFATGTVAGASSAIVTSLEKRPASMEQKATALRIARMAEARQRGSGTEVEMERETSLIAVETVPSEDQRGQSAIMIYDTKEDRFVDDQVRELRVKPGTGEMIQFETYFTEYVGDGTEAPKQEAEKMPAEEPDQPETPLPPAREVDSIEPIPEVPPLPPETAPAPQIPDVPAPPAPPER